MTAFPRGTPTFRAKEQKFKKQKKKTENESVFRLFRQ